MLGNLAGVDNIGESLKPIVNLEVTEDSPDYSYSLLEDRIKPVCWGFDNLFQSDFKIYRSR